MDVHLRMVVTLIESVYIGTHLQMVLCIICNIIVIMICFVYGQ